MKLPTKEEIQNYFTKRAPVYNRSAAWVKDGYLKSWLLENIEVNRNARVLDIATGPGALASVFYRRAGLVIGLDFTPAMCHAARGKMDCLVYGDGEILPFAAGSFDLIVVRQGLQFMNLVRAMPEIYRIAKPGSRTVIIQLTAYNRDDCAETFEIQRLRNPVRQNFFLEEDLKNLLKKNGWNDAATVSYYSYESVSEWITKAAIPADRQEQIRRIYKNSSPAFQQVHEIKFSNGDIIDKMKMTIAVGEK